MKLLILALLLLVVCATTGAQATPYEETRCCVTPARNPDGSIKRDRAVVRAFQKLHPCPSTGLTYGGCPNWQLDHVISLVCGGKDEVSNMQWLPIAIKSAQGTLPKDRWEQKVYCRPQELVK